MSFSIYSTTWQRESSDLMALRRAVFIVEQNIPEELEWDEYDTTALHFACRANATTGVVGTARLILPTEHRKAMIGRLCVAQPFRHQKVATQLMQKMLAYCADQKILLIELHAQLYLKAFYESFGFITQGDVYLEAGIEHITMTRGQPTQPAP